VGRGRAPRAPWPGGARRRLIGGSGDSILIAGSTDGADGIYDKARKEKKRKDCHV